MSNYFTTFYILQYPSSLNVGKPFNISDKRLSEIYFKIDLFNLNSQLLGECMTTIHPNMAA